MNKHLLKVSGLATLVLLLHTSGFAQDAAGEGKTDTAVKRRNYDEIIIRRKSDKDAKLTIEIKDGQVFVNGKPANEYEDKDLSVRRKKIRNFSYYGPGGGAIIAPPGGPDGPGELGDLGQLDEDQLQLAPFRDLGGVRGFQGDGWPGAGSRAFLGVTSQRQKQGPEGALIMEVAKGSAAEKGGLRTGDLITRLDETSIDGPESLSEVVRQYKPQDKVTITFKRQGKEQRITVILGKSAVKTGPYELQYGQPFKFDFKMPPGMQGYGWNDDRPKLGIKAQDTEDGKGVKVIGVDEESAAAKAGIKEGDIITSFDGKEVSDARRLAELAQESKSKPAVQVHLLRDGKPMDVEVRVPKKLKTADL